MNSTTNKSDFVLRLNGRSSTVALSIRYDCLHPTTLECTMLLSDSGPQGQILISDTDIGMRQQSSIVHAPRFAQNVQRQMAVFRKFRHHTCEDWVQRVDD